MGNKTNSVASIGVTNLTTMAISKCVAFVGATLMFVGCGGMLLSRNSLSEPEVKYLREHVNMK